MNRLAVFMLCGFTTALVAQQARPAFEVASVKLHSSDDRRVTMVLQPGGRLIATTVPLRFVIRTAYQVQDDQIVGGPDWLDTDRFDIDARAEVGSDATQIAAMLQSLLADRFNLTIHREMRELSVLALQRTKQGDTLGPALHPTNCPELGIDLRRATPCANISNGSGFLTLRGMPISQFAQYLAPDMNRVVIDRTGLNGRYDIDLKWSPQPQIGATPPLVDSQDRPSLFTALQEQLGLKLESSRGLVEVLVVDTVAHPTPN